MFIIFKGQVSIVLNLGPGSAEVSSVSCQVFGEVSHRPVSREQTADKLRDCNAFAGAPLSDERLEAALSAALGIANLPATSALTSLFRV